MFIWNPVYSVVFLGISVDDANQETTETTKIEKSEKQEDTTTAILIFTSLLLKHTHTLTFRFFSLFNTMRDETLIVFH